MRFRSVAAIAAISLVGVTVSGCTGQNQLDGCEPYFEPGEVSRSVEVTGDAGSNPEVSFSVPLVAQSQEVSFIDAGEGDRRASEGDIVRANYAIYSGKTGEMIASSFPDAGMAGAQQLSLAVSDERDINQAISCMSDGSRIVFATTMGAVYGDQSNAELDLTPSDTAIIVLEANRVFPGRAEGASQPGNAQLPAVSLAPNGQPGLTFTGADAPNDLVVSTTIEGSGPVIEEGDSVVVHYTGVVWETQQVFDSSWDSGTPATFPIQTGQLIDGVVQGLVGQRIGSQVLMSIPQELAYNDPATRPSSIPEGAHLVFVFDLLGKDN